MLKYIFFLQAVIYLIIMPTLHERMDVIYRPPLFAGILACLSLVAGLLICAAFAKRQDQTRPVRTDTVKPRKFVIIGFFILALGYAYVSWSNGLLNRRQGSELMAEIYGNLPIYELFVLRIFEIAFIPTLVLYLFFDRNPYERLAVALISLMILPFMGIEDSRGRLIVILINVLSFIRPAVFVKYLYSNLRIYIAGISVFGVFYYVTAQRSNNYFSFSDFLYSEFITRLDGMELISELGDYGFIKYWGSFDWNMFSPLISRIPFLEAAQAAKIAGLTSTKQYYLKQLLGTDRLDNSNSMLADPLYFAGLGGVVVCFLIMGYAIGRFDLHIKSGRFGTSRISLAIAMSFAMSYSVIEVDFLGAFTTWVQNLIVCAALVFVGTTLNVRNNRITARFRSPVSHNSQPA